MNLNLLHLTSNNKLRVILSLIWLISIDIQPYLSAQSTHLDNTWTEKGNNALVQEKFLDAIRYYQQGRDVFKNEKNQVGLIESDIKIALVYSTQDSLDAALAYISKTTHLAEQILSPLSETLALAYHKRGLIHYNRFEDSLAVAYYLKAIKIREDNRENKNEDIIRGYRNVGELFEYLDQPKEARKHLEVALKRANFIENIDSQLKLEIYQLLGRLYKNYGDLDQAKAMTEYAINHYEQLETTNKDILQNKAIAFDEYGKILRDLYIFDEAEKIFNLSLELIQQLFSEEVNIEKADILNNLGLSYFKQQKFELALSKLKQSLTINNLLSKREHAILNNQLNIAATHNKLNQCDKSLPLLNALLEKPSSSKELRFQSKVHDNLGDAYRCQGKLELSLKNYNQSIYYLTDLSNRNDLYYTPSIDAIKIDKKQALTTLFSKAKTLTAIYENNNSISALETSFLIYQKLDTLIQEVRQSFLAEESKLSLASEMKPIYEAALSVSYKLSKTSNSTSLTNKYALAFYDFIEKSKGITLLDAVRHTQAKSFYDVDNNELEKQLSLDIKYHTEKEFNQETKKLASQEQLIILKKNRSEYIQQLENSNASYYEYKYNRTVPSVDELLSQIDEHTTIIDYFIGESNNYAITINYAQGLRIHKLPIYPDELNKLVQNYNQSIYTPFVTANHSNKPDLNINNQLFAKSSYKLYKNLIESLNMIETNKLIIVPDDILNLLSFDALLSQKVTKGFLGVYGNQDQYNFLLYKYQISYCYSTSLLKAMYKSNSLKGKNQLLTFHTLEFENQINSLKKIFSPWNQFIYSLGKKSQRATFNEIAQQYRYLHFSLHGVINNQHPDQSHFIMRAKEKSERPLYLGILYNTPLQAEMVVTSSCDAGIGKISKGEGVLSLARGFSYAGVKSIITSLWEIKDGPTGDLLSYFYTFLKDGINKDQALQQAKKKFIQSKGDDYAHPYYWAGFIPIGNMQSIDIPFVPSLELKIGLGIGLLLLSLLFLFRGKLFTQ